MGKEKEQDIKDIIKDGTEETENELTNNKGD